MENAVNKRVLMLKTELRLTDIEFCGRASISTGTLHRIKNDEEITQKVLNLIISNLNVSSEWLLNGKGKMFVEVKMQTSENPYKDALVAELKGQVTYLQEMLRLAMSGKKGSFLNALGLTAETYLLPGKSQGTVSRGHS